MPLLLIRDEALADAVLRDRRWDDDPIKLYDELIERHGLERATEIWMLACTRYDEASEA